MRDRTGRAARQAASIFLLVATLSSGILPPQVLDAPRSFLMDVTGFPAAPLHFVVAQIRDVIDDGLLSGPSRGDLENEIKRLTAELVRKDAELARARQTIASFEGLRSVSRRDPLFVWSGDLVGYNQGGDTDVFSRSYVVSVGTRDGAGLGMPVVWGNIALGRISVAGAFYSRVRVLADPQSRVCVRFANSRHEGVLVGSGRQTCSVRYVSNKVEEGDINPGDVVITSGTDTLFPPGLVVGKVTRFVRQPSQPEALVDVEFFIDYSRLENCLVLKRDNQPIKG